MPIDIDVSTFVKLNLTHEWTKYNKFINGIYFCHCFVHSILCNNPRSKNNRYYTCCHFCDLLLFDNFTSPRRSRQFSKVMKANAKLYIAIAQWSSKYAWSKPYHQQYTFVSFSMRVMFANCFHFISFFDGRKFIWNQLKKITQEKKLKKNRHQTDRRHAIHCFLPFYIYSSFVVFECVDV